MSRIDDLIAAQAELEKEEIQKLKNLETAAFAKETALMEQLRPSYEYMLRQLGLDDLPARYEVGVKYKDYLTHEVTVQVDDWVLIFFLHRSSANYMQLSIEILPETPLTLEEKRDLQAAWIRCYNSGYVLPNPHPDWLQHTQHQWEYCKKISFSLKRNTEKGLELTPELEGSWLYIKAGIGNAVQFLRLCLDKDAIYTVHDQINKALKRNAERDALIRAKQDEQDRKEREVWEEEDRKKREVWEEEELARRERARLVRIRHEEEKLAAEWAEEIAEEQETIAELQQVDHLRHFDRDTLFAMYYMVNRIVNRHLKAFSERTSHESD